jgi:DNA-binding SARP family transcriptional activator
MIVAMTSLQIRLLGPFEVSRDNHPLDAKEWRSRQNRTILKVLLCRRGTVVPADQLLEILWPDDNIESARRRLHVRISQLRHAMAPDDPTAFIITASGGYIFRPQAEF